MALICAAPSVMLDDRHGFQLPFQVVGRVLEEAVVAAGPDDGGGAAGLDHHEAVHAAGAHAVARGRALDERPPRARRRRRRRRPRPAARRSASGSGDAFWVGGDEAADVGAHAGEGRATFVEARADGGELGLAGADELLGRALVGRELAARSVSSRLVVSMVRTTSLSQRAMVRTMVSCVTRSPRSAAPKTASIGLTSSCLYMATARAASVARARLSSLYARRWSRRFSLSCRRTASSARVAREYRVTAEPICASSEEISAARASALSRFSWSAPVRAPAGAASAPRRPRARDGEQGGQRQTTYRVAVVQCASSRQAAEAARSVLGRPVSGPARRAGCET